MFVWSHSKNILPKTVILVMCSHLKSVLASILTEISLNTRDWKQTKPPISASLYRLAVLEYSFNTAKQFTTALAYGDWD